MQFRTVRIAIALAVALLAFIFFAPLVPFRTQAVCSSMFCQLMPTGGFYTGYNSIGLLLFHWGASLDTSFGIATYNPPIIIVTLGGSPSLLTAFGVWEFILFPITLFISALLSPEEFHLISTGISRLRQLKHNSQD